MKFEPDFFLHHILQWRQLQPKKGVIIQQLVPYPESDGDVTRPGCSLNLILNYNLTKMFNRATEQELGFGKY